MRPSASNDGALLCGVMVLQLVVLTVIIPSPLEDDAIGRLATGWSADVATNGRFADSGGWSSADARRSAETGFSRRSTDTGGAPAIFSKTKYFSSQLHNIPRPSSAHISLPNAHNNL